MADDKPSKPFPPRWAMIYMLVLILAAIVWIILAACTGIRPGITIGDCEIPRMTGRSGTQRARGLPGCGSLPDRESGANCTGQRCKARLFVPRTDDPVAELEQLTLDPLAPQRLFSVASRSMSAAISALTEPRMSMPNGAYVNFPRRDFTG